MNEIKVAKKLTKKQEAKLYRCPGCGEQDCSAAFLGVPCELMED